jgi:hypothetical protein
LFSSSSEYLLAKLTKYHSDNNGENVRWYGEIIPSEKLKFYFLKRMNNIPKYERSDKG